MRYGPTCLAVLLLGMWSCSDGAPEGISNESLDGAQGGSGGVEQGGAGGGDDNVGAAGGSDPGAGGTGGAGDGGSIGAGGSGGDAEWAPTGGPPGVFAYEIAGTSTGTMLATTPDGLLRSLDDGLTWTRDPTTSLGHLQYLLEVDGSLYFPKYGTGLYRSDDDGATWTLVLVGWENVDYIVSTANGTLYTLYYGTGGAPMLRSSTDDGLTWVDVGPLPVSWAQLLAAGNTIYLVVGDSLYSSTDGLSWTQVAVPVPFGFGIFEFGGSIYGNGITTGIFRSDDGGATWVADSPPMAAQDGYQCPAAVVGSSLWAANTDGLYERTGTGWVRRGEMGSGDKRCPRDTGGDKLWSYYLDQLAFFDATAGSWSPVAVTSARSGMLNLDGDGQVLFTSNMNGHTFRTADAGATWSRIDIRTQRVLRIGGSDWIASGVDGLFLSSDGGATWQLVDPNLHPTGFAISTGDLLAAANYELHRSTNGGLTWTSLMSGFPTLAGGMKDAIGGAFFDGANIFAFGGQHTWLSTDGGATFTSVSNGTFVLSQIARMGSTLVGYGVTLPDRKADFFHSTDNGATWQRANGTLPGPSLHRFVEVNGDLYATLRMREGMDRADVKWVYKSADAGVTWARVGTDPFPVPAGGLVAVQNELFVALDGEGVWKLELP